MSVSEIGGQVGWLRTMMTRRPWSHLEMDFDIDSWLGTYGGRWGLCNDDMGDMDLRQYEALLVVMVMVMVMVVMKYCIMIFR